MKEVPPWELNLQLLTKLPKKPVEQKVTYNVMYLESIAEPERLVVHTATVAESESLSKTIRVDITFAASSTKYNLLLLKK